jgi:hypothetical protein
MAPAMKATAQQNSAALYVNLLEMRETGRHALYLSTSSNGFAQEPVPDEGCSLFDRAMIDESQPGNAAIVQMLGDALNLNKRISIRVDGCLGIQVGSSTTAPRLVKVNFTGEF